ncbi:hypothetical protein Isop_3687 [Isosphaera pallida ATCC 43644]|jgi:hypothetical protein|uniref:Uncharacterized protein n=1 Tax=Isosphaera pallida (strain ATCC 43644 / DSM 9630 / IS1B) TaxID=575540 RepID=E8QZB4_ISOPI|nr:hypothetical protein [Isosphaera pallida]ADV64243.1 hypothetical protein Isop_3687 [Isosphaera pallida ATCC 43644]
MTGLETGGQGGLTPSTTPAKPLNPQADSKLEYDLLILVSQLERMLESLRSERKAARPLAAVQTACDLIEHVFRFADGRVELQAKVIERSERVLNESQSLREKFEGLSKREAEAFFNADPNAGGLREDHRRFGLMLRSALEGYFVLFAASFTDPARVQTWRQTFKVFLDDLIRRWVNPENQTASS